MKLPLNLRVVTCVVTNFSLSTYILNNLTDHTSQNDDILANWLISSEDNLVVAIFFAEWAGSVEILRGFMERTGETFPDIEIHWINIEQRRDLSADLGVSAIPSIILFRNREVVDHILGLLPRRKIEDRIRPHR